MSVEKVREYLKQYGVSDEIIEFESSSATVELAAQRLGVLPQRIAKTLSFIVDDRCVLIVTAGDARIDNKKYKQIFGQKAKMIESEDVERLTGHEVGGVCPFGNPEGVSTYMDISMKRFDTVFPACGGSKTAIELTPDRLFEYGGALDWVDVCKDWE